MTETVAISLTDSAWTQIGHGNSTVAVDIKTASQILINANDSATPPAIDAPGVAVGDFVTGPNIVCEGLSGSEYIWARSKSGAAEIVVIRK